MMKFENWNRLFEAFSDEKLQDFAENIAKELQDVIKMDFYVIPNFEKFTRDDEPVQIGYLLTNDKLHSLRLNFTENNELYSVDYWNPTSTESNKTLYLNDVSIERAISKIISFYKSGGGLNEDVVISKPIETKEADKNVIKAEEEYELQDVDTIFDDLITYTDMVVDGDLFSLIISGQAGVGKTFLLTKELQEKGLKRNEDFFKITGKTTAAALYISLYEHNDKILVYDDCDSVFKNDDAVNVLKGALDTTAIREISWSSAALIKSKNKVEIPKSFDFTGKVIFVSNIPKKKIDKALKTRAFILEIALSTGDMIERMWTLLPTISMPSGIKVNGFIKERAMNLLVEEANKTVNLELSLRTLIKAIAIVNKVAKEETARRLIRQQCQG